MKTPPRCATWLILAMVLQLHWFKIMFLGALKVVREKFAKNNNSNSLRNNSDSNQEDHSTNETSSALTAPNNRTPNNNHESEFVAKEDIIKTHQKSD